MSSTEPPPAARNGLVKNQTDLIAGLVMIAVAAGGLIGSLQLAFQLQGGIGPGMMPRATAVLLALLGAALVANSLYSPGHGLDRFSIRGLFFVLGAALLFAWTIRPLGLVIAGPLAILFSAFADRQTRLVEIIPFAIVLTAASILLFSWGIRLPIPVWPSELPPIPYLPVIKL